MQWASPLKQPFPFQKSFAGFFEVIIGRKDFIGHKNTNIKKPNIISSLLSTKRKRKRKEFNMEKRDWKSLYLISYTFHVLCGLNIFPTKQGMLGWFFLLNYRFFFFFCLIFSTSIYLPYSKFSTWTIWLPSNGLSLIFSLNCFPNLLVICVRVCIYVTHPS